MTEIPFRAEKWDMNALRETFESTRASPNPWDTVDHHILFSRRGTGKAQAVSYLVAEANAKGDIALNLDLRTVGSPDGLLDPEAAPLALVLNQAVRDAPADLSSAARMTVRSRPGRR
ncbi:hypothetical protein [Saccharothrix obliqua]|uniref:hypothetical protein n=1 Tax=Saccharothrix obliqua TaxID=2861747 RepID=UPI002151B324|nr:hypothetical protein [Saccharothrix obliqua]